MDCVIKGGDEKELKFRAAVVFWRRCRGELIHLNKFTDACKYAIDSSSKL